jgi:chemotaxis protein methyltransferase CheR
MGSQTLRDLHRRLDGIVEYLRKRTGLDLSEEKYRRRLEKTLRDQIRRRNLGEADKYLEQLTRGDFPEDVEKIIDDVTVTETLLFRYEDQMDFFKRQILTELVDRKPATDIDLLSAGTSRGIELFTIAIKFAQHPQFNLKYGSELPNLLGVDINQSALEEARAGQFSKRMVEHAPDPVVDGYFRTVEDGYRAIDSIQQLVSFQQKNLVKDSLGGPWDVIFVRNVLYYFESGTRTRILRKLIKNLKKNGYLVLAPTESLNESREIRDSLNHLEHSIYRYESGSTDQIHSLSRPSSDDTQTKPSSTRVVRLEGNLRGANPDDTESLRKLLEEDAVDDSVERVKIDLTEAEYIDRKFYSILRRAIRFLEKQNCEIQWRFNLEDSVTQALNRWGLDLEEVAEQ